MIGFDQHPDDDYGNERYDDEQAEQKRGRFLPFVGGMALTAVVITGAAATYDYFEEGGTHIAAAGRYLEGFGTTPQDSRNQAQPEAVASPSVSPTTTEPEQTESPLPSPSPEASSSVDIKVPAPPEQSANEKAPLIVLDPGHDGKTHSTIDPRTGLEDQGYRNIPETGEMYRVTMSVRKQLKADGYRVLVTKDRARDSKTFRERAGMAIDNRADLEVSIHNDHGQGPNFQAVYEQFVGGYRGENHEAVCGNRKVAKKSHEYALAIAKARTEAQGHKVTIQRNNFDNRTGLEPGNLSIIQVFACMGDENGKHAVPEVYNEMGALTGGEVHNRASERALRDYATGLINGIEAAIPYEPTHTSR